MRASKRPEDKEIKERLELIASKPFARMSYTEAVEARAVGLPSVFTVSESHEPLVQRP